MDGVALELHVLEGPDRERVFRVGGTASYVYGRAGTPDLDLGLPTDGRVGRRHLVFDLTSARPSVRVAEPKYGLWVDGRATTSAALADGALLALGDTRLKVVLPRAPGAPPGPPDLPPLAVPRRSLADFELGPELGRGGLGRVLDARDRVSGERVALKLMREDLLGNDLAVAHFVREMDVLARVRHEHVVKALAVGRDEGQLFLAMELLPGRDLERLVRDGWTLAEGEAIAVGVALLGALAHAHRLGVVHRDVKPHNVMVHRPDGGRLTAWLLDFGLAKPLADGSGAGLTETGQAKGTFAFAAPECLVDAKHVTPAADLYSAAATLYWALTGHYYFDEDKYVDGFLRAVLEADVVPLRTRRPALSADLARFVEDGLHALPARRWPSASQALERLAALGGTTASNRAP